MANMREMIALAIVVLMISTPVAYASSATATAGASASNGGSATATSEASASNEGSAIADSYASALDGGSATSNSDVIASDKGSAIATSSTEAYDQDIDSDARAIASDGGSAIATTINGGNSEATALEDNVVIDITIMGESATESDNVENVDGQDLDMTATVELDNSGDVTITYVDTIYLLYDCTGQDYHIDDIFDILALRQ